MADAPTTPGPLLAFAEWCLSANFDSRDIGMRARAAIAKAANTQRPAAPGSPERLATDRHQQTDSEGSGDHLESNSLTHPVGGWRPITKKAAAVIARVRERLAEAQIHDDKTEIFRCADIEVLLGFAPPTGQTGKDHE